MSIKEEPAAGDHSQPPHLEDDDDPIVAEYDVFVSQQLAGKTHLFQYPLRPKSTPYPMDSVSLSVTPGLASQRAQEAQKAAGNKAAAFDPFKQELLDETGAKVSNASRFTMDINVQTFGSPNFDPSHPAMQADSSTNVDGGDRTGATAMFGSADGCDNTQRVKLQSTPFNPKCTYAVAVLKQGEVHITPLTSIQQFSPQVTSPQQYTGMVPRPEEDPRLMSTILSKDAGSVTIGAMQQHLQRQLGKTRSSSLHKDHQQSFPLDYSKRDSPDSIAIAQRLMCPTLTQSLKPRGQHSQATSSGTRQMDDTFFPLDTTTDPTAKVTKNITIRYSDAYRLTDQVKDLLVSSQVLPLSRLMPLLSGTFTETQVIEELKRYAVLVHGLWVSRVNVLHTGNSAAIREYVISLFATSAHGKVTRQQILQAFGPDPACARIVGSILPTLAILLDHSTGGPAPSPEYPNERWWQLRGLGVTEESDDMPTARGFKSHAMYYEQTYPQEVASQTAYLAARQQEILLNMDQIRIGKTLNPRRLQLAGGGAAMDALVNRTPASARAAGAGSPQGGGDAEKEKQIMQARQYIRSVFLQYGVINREIFKDRLKQLNQQRSSPIFQLPLGALQAAMQAELQNGVLDGTWMLKSVDPLTDQYRRYVIMEIKETRSFVAKELGDRVNLGLSKDQKGPIPDSHLTKLINDLAEFRQGERQWHAKTGMVQWSTASGSIRT